MVSIAGTENQCLLSMLVHSYGPSIQKEDENCTFEASLDFRVRSRRYN